MAWSLTDTAESIRAGRELEGGLPNAPEFDMRYWNLVAVAERDEDFASRLLRKRVAARRWAATERV